MSEETPSIVKIKDPKIFVEGDDLLTEKKKKFNTSKSYGLHLQVSATFALSFLHLLNGVIFGFTGIALPSIRNSSSTNDSNSEDISMTTEQVSIYTGSLVIGSITGGLLISPVVAKYGQRITLLITTPMSVVAWLLSYFSRLFSIHILSRILLGMHATILSSLTVTYIAEMSHSSVRGRLMAVTDFFRQLGFLFVFGIGSTHIHWRTVGLICGLTPLIIPTIVLFFLPDSPRWLASSGKQEGLIKKSLQFYRGKYTDVEKEYLDIEEDINKFTNKLGIWDQLLLLKDKSLLKRFLFLLYVNFSTNITGNYTIVSYSVTIFNAAKTGINSYMSTLLCGAVRVGGSLLYIALADRFGRRPLVLLFLSLSGVCTLAIFIYFYLFNNAYDVSNIRWLPLSSMLLYTLFTCLSHPVTRLLRNELLPNNFRQLGVNISFAVFFLGAFFVASTYPLIADGIGPEWAFFMYSINTAVLVIVIAIVLPETKGKTLEEISKLF